MIIIKKLCFLQNYNTSKGITRPGCRSHPYFKQTDIKFCTRTVQTLHKYCTPLNKWYFNQHHATLTAWSSNWYQWKFIFLKFLHLIAMKAISWLPFIFMKFHKKQFYQAYTTIFILSTTKSSWHFLAWAGFMRINVKGLVWLYETERVKQACLKAHCKWMGF